MKKRGMSMIISAVIMILLVLIAMGLVWVAVKNIVDEGVGETESCFGIFGKVDINDRYTCYNSSSGEVQFSVDIGDIDVEKVIVSISTIGGSSSIEIYEGAVYPNVKDYNGDYNLGISFPGKNSGRTYVASGFSQKVDSIMIAPVINGRMCDSSDSTNEIYDCLLIA